MQAKEFNPQVFLEFLCYSFSAGLIAYLAASGKYLNYVTPRMEGYLYFTAAILLIWAAAGLRRMFRPQYRIRVAHCFVLVVPMVLLLLPHRQLSSSELAARYSSGSTFTGISVQNELSLSGNVGDFVAATVIPDSAAGGTTRSLEATLENAIAQNVVSPTATAESKVMSVGTPLLGDNSEAAQGESAVISGMQVNMSGLPGLDVENKKIVVDNDHFYSWINEIYLHMHEYEGFQVSMTGFVFKNPNTMEADEFVPARLTMSCCVADLMPSGLLCKYDKAADLTADSWVTVEGTVQLTKFRNFDDVRIHVTAVYPAEEVEGYIYPY